MLRYVVLIQRKTILCLVCSTHKFKGRGALKQEVASVKQFHKIGPDTLVGKGGP